ncbi:MAG: ROK family protein [Vulcanisaeta sp.]|jgi:glucokinase|nr:MAG: ROK family transcriptional regulator [Vulcanisaeta sp. JCHS_4]KUO85074.1 MAG: ROK family transcriptional regulator [Vulcanisaeta sp. MG_3]MCG2864353.1 ROK family protein [Vulcanisaeta sp.]MCG2866077.1 ROK family protein [Vulcanisaeta sp.]MCG2884981.1 ROK family protein [Vulcanisaeta sp.]
MVYVGIDVGATFIRVGLVDEGGSVIDKLKVRQPSSGDENTVAEVIIKAVKNLARSRSIAGIGIGSIGPLDLKSGIVPLAPNAPIKRFKLVEPIIREFRVPVVLGNDAMAAVWGEYVFGIGKGIRNLVYITFSTGIGAGVIVDGHLLIGKDGNAHEIGHAVIDIDSNIQCGCGGYGHWEALGSGANVPRVIKEFIKGKTYRSRLHERLSRNEYVSTEEVFQAYYDGDELARDFIDNFLMRVHAAGIATVMNAYDPELIVLGGSMALNNKELFRAGIGRYLGRYLTVRAARIEFTEFGDDIGIVGAAALVYKVPDSLREFVEGYNKYLQ